MTRSTWMPALASAAALLAVALPHLGASEEAPDPAENGPEAWTFDARQRLQPAAELDHFKHASSKGLQIACTRCHHTSKGTDVEAGCGDCHGSAWNPDVPDVKSATHQLCIGCHVLHGAKSGVQPAPYKCRGCHKGAPPPR